MNEFDHIKNSFGAEKDTAPSDLWSKIDQSMNVNTVAANHIANSFNHIEEKAPEKVWDSIQDQIDINKSWIGIRNHLVRSETSKRFMRYIAILFLIILVFVPFNLNDEFSISTNSNLFLADSGNEITDKIDHSKNSNTLQTTYANFQHPAQLMEIANTSNEASSLVISQNPEKQDESNYSNYSITSQKSVFIDSVFRIKPREITLLSSVFSELALFPLDSSLLNYIEPKKLSEKLSLGVVVNVNNTWLINNETREGFDENSIVENRWSFNHSIGLFGRYDLNDRYSIESQFHFINNYSQSNFQYLNGEYINKTIDLKSLKYSFLVNRKMSYNTTISGGLFCDYFYSKEEHINEETRITNLAYSTYNWGLKLEVSKSLNRIDIPLEIGLNSEFGIKNLTTQFSPISKQLNPNRTIVIGAFIKMKVL